MSSSDDGVTGGGYLDRGDGMSPTEAVRALFTAPMLAIAGGLSFLIGSMFESIADIGQVVRAAWGFLVALLTEPTIILEMTARASAISISESFGLLAFPVGVGIIIIAFYLWELSGIGIPIIDRVIPGLRRD